MDVVEDPGGPCFFTVVTVRRAAISPVTHAQMKATLTTVRREDTRSARVRPVSSRLNPLVFNAACRFSACQRRAYRRMFGRACPRYARYNMSPAAFFVAATRRFTP